MKINNSYESIYPSKQVKSQEKQIINKKKPGIIKDEFVKSEKTNKVTYDKPKASVDSKTIQRLKAESERNYSNLREMVKQLLEKQGMTFKDIENSDAVVKIDEATRLEAQSMIGESGPLSPEVLSDKIVEFAKAISGGNKEKYDVLKNAIDDGFKEAARILGGELPEISQKTYDIVMEKLNKWQQDDSE